MNVKKFLIAVLLLGVVMTLFDYVVHGLILQRMMYSDLTSVLRQDAPPYLFVLGDFVAALVFLWVYDRVYSSFAPGPKGGATYGLYAGVLVSFPAYISLNLIIVGFPYGLAWTWTIGGILWGVVAGAVAGAWYKK